MRAEQIAETKHERKARHTSRWVAIVVGVILLAILVDMIILLRHWPFTRKALTETLQSRSSGTVQIGRFHETFFPPGCVAEDVRFSSSAGAGNPPPLTIHKLAIRGNYGDLLTFHRRVDELRVTGVHVVFPPKGSGGSMPLREGKSKSTLAIGKAVAEDSVLEFLPRQQGENPYRIAIQRLVLPNFGSGGSVPYEATLTISRPAGAIQSKGRFGPWNSGDPGQTPVSGSFTYTHADLGISRDISGILDGNGKFDGLLGHINVSGSTDVPDFHVGRSAHKLRLTTEYNAVVNGTNGDTSLKLVRAHLLRTTGMFDGAVAGEQGQPGKTLSLNMRVTNGRVEDLLLIFTEKKEAGMDGEISLHGKARVPPGPRPFLQKLLLAGDFSIAAAHFTRPSTQNPIDRLSKSAEGEKKDQIEGDPRIMLADVKGHVSTKNGVAMLTNVTFTVPGAVGRLHGTFTLETKMVNLHGVLDTTGKLSDSTSGFKALVLKAITPFYKKKKANKSLTVMPFTITGPIGHTKMGLDIGK